MEQQDGVHPYVKVVWSKIYQKGNEWVIQHLYFHRTVQMENPLATGITLCTIAGSIEKRATVRDAEDL